MDNNNRLDKIIINYTLSAKLITFYKLNCKFRRERVKINVIQNFLQTLSLFTRLKLNRLNKNTTCLVTGLQGRSQIFIMGEAGVTSNYQLKLL